METPKTYFYFELHATIKCIFKFSKSHFCRLLQEIASHKGCSVNFKPEPIACHSAIGRSYKVYICVEWFKTSQKSAERVLDSEQHARYGLLCRV